ncbi:MAG: hypothetical protein KDD82_08960, partial [Planctomycetes bacterium]|nr:hypothetical protein [Planctomycetota bacterium]
MLTLPLRPFCCAALAVLLAAQSGWACGPAPWSRAQAQALGDELARVAGEPLASLRRIRGVPSLTPAPRWGQRAAPVHGDALEAQGVWVNLQSVRAVRVAYASAAVAEEQAARLLLHLSEPTSAGEALSFSAAAWPSDAPLASAEELAAADRRDTQAAQQLAAPAALILEVRGRELLLLAGSLGKDLDRVAALRTAAWGVRAQACGVQLVAAASQPT